MRPYIIGVGHAGGMFADAALKLDRGLYYATVFNTHVDDLARLRRVDDRVLIGKAYLDGKGAGKNREVGKTIGEKYVGMMMDKVKERCTQFNPDAFLVVASGAGATGSGMAPVIASEIKNVKELRDKPVYGLLFLPSTSRLPVDEKDRILTISNAIGAFDELHEAVDSLILVDAECFERKYTPETLTKFYERLDREVARMLHAVFKGEEQARKKGAEEVVGTSEIRETLAGGKVSVLGFYSRGLHGVLRKAAPLPDDVSNAIIATTQPEALSFPTNVKKASRVLVVPFGRPEHLYENAIASGVGYIEKMLRAADVRRGAYEDPKAKEIGAVTLYAGVEDLSKIDKLRKVKK